LYSECTNELIVVNEISHPYFIHIIHDIKWKRVLLLKASTLQWERTFLTRTQQMSLWFEFPNQFCLGLCSFTWHCKEMRKLGCQLEPLRKLLGLRPPPERFKFNLFCGADWASGILQPSRS
jgi:hypothetical protein